MIVVQSSDVLQYVWGKLLGRYKIAPSKTVESFAGGVASATALWWITPFSVFHAGLLPSSSA